MPKYLRSVSIIVLMLLIVSGFFAEFSYAVSNEVTIPVNGRKTFELDKWDLMWPLSDYRIGFYLTISYSGKSTFYWEVDKGTISPGEALSLRLTLKKGVYLYKATFRVVVEKSSTKEIVFDKPVDVRLGEIEVPGSYDRMLTSIPIIPFEIAGIPVELSLSAKLTITTGCEVLLETYGLEPSPRIISFESSTSETIVFSKSRGVGADIYLSGVRVKNTGYIVLSVSLTILNMLTPLKTDLGKIPLGDFASENKVNIKLITLKTPIKIDLLSNTNSIKLGDTVMLEGTIEPKVKDIPVKIFANKKLIATVKTDENGRYSYVWKPVEPGTYEVYAIAEETTYTTSAGSQKIVIVVEKPGLLNEVILAIAAIAIIGVAAITIYMYKRSSSK